jgi:hypothetical protein
MTVMTIHGEMSKTELDKKEGSFENEQERTEWVEYRVKGSDAIVHRSVHVIIKESLTTSSKIGE